ncbi:MAG: STAS domain-containing protein [Chloroflexota bacterium]
MPEAKVTMTVRKPNSTVSIIDIEGQVTGFAEKVMNEVYEEANANGASFILLNFAKLEYMNSSGIGLIVTMLIRAQRNNNKLAAYGLSPHYRQIFELTRLEDAIAIFETEADALEAV